MDILGVIPFEEAAIEEGVIDGTICPANPVVSNPNFSPF
jgi:hypothetical protein